MNIGIIGLGVIGGSFGRAFRKKTGHIVYGYDISSDTMLKADMLSALHHPLSEADYPLLDVLIIALNPRAFRETLTATAGKLKNGAIVIDIGGNKKCPVLAMRAAAEQYPNIHFIATHPMAGREFYGIKHAIPSLFEGASTLMIPVAADINARSVMKNLLLEAGFANVILTEENEHDGIIAYTSQLAHIISSAYVNNPKADVHDGFSAGSFRDLTRVAKMNTSMWTELVSDNRENILRELDIFRENVNAFYRAIESKDEAALQSLFEKGNAKKEAVEKATREWKKNN